MTVYCGIQEVRGVPKFWEFFRKAARNCWKCKCQISNITTPLHDDPTNLRCLHSLDNISYSCKRIRHICTSLTCIVCCCPTDTDVLWWKYCPKFIKVCKELPQQTQCPNADTISTVFKHPLYGRPMIICSDNKMDQIWIKHFLHNVCQS